MKTTFAFAMTMAAASAWTSNYQFSLNDLESFTIGFFKGAIEESLPDVMTCVQDGENLVTDIEKAIADFKKENFDGVKNGIKEIGTIVKSISTDIKDCQAGVKGAEDIIKMAENFENPWKFAYHLAKDLLVNGVQIYHQIDDSIKAYDAGQIESFGEHVGEALALVLVGQVDPNASCVVPTGVVFEDATCFMRELCGTDCATGECKWAYPEGGSPDDAECACAVCNASLFLH